MLYPLSYGRPSVRRTRREDWTRIADLPPGSEISLIAGRLSSGFAAILLPEQSRGQAVSLNYGEPQRKLLESRAVQLYEDAAAEGGIKADDPRIAEGGPDRDCFELLVELQLLRQTGDGAYVAGDPTSVQARVIAPMGQRGLELMQESAAWAKAFGSLTDAWRRAPSAEPGPFTYLHGSENINRFLTSVIGDAQTELLTAQPQSGRSPATLAAGADRDLAALERGVTMRTLYQHAARRNSATQAFVKRAVSLGAEVRTVDEFFNRMIVIDRDTAVIPGHQGLSVAVAIREPSIVAHLVDVFERTWDRARPYTEKDGTSIRDIASEQRAMTIRMLIEGHGDATSAKRLGVSTRAYAGYVSDLKAEYEVLTRFQLGYALGRRGETGSESHPPEKQSEDG